MIKLSMRRLAKPLSALLVVLNTAAALPAVSALAEEAPSIELSEVYGADTQETVLPAEEPEYIEADASGDGAAVQEQDGINAESEDLSGEEQTEAPGPENAAEPAEEEPGVDEDWSGENVGTDGAETPKGGYDFPVDAYGNRYYIDPGTGYRHTGWLLLEGLWYYFWSDGTLATGWVYLSGDWYYFDLDTGIVHRGWIETSDGNRYYMRPEDGIEQKYWRQIDGYWYYFGSDGKMCRGWNLANDGYWYYFEDSGIVHRGWIETSDGERYYMRPSDATEQKGWCKIDDYWYYFGNDGKMCVGWQLIGGYKYYFYKQTDDGPWGANAADVVIDGYYVNPSGYTSASWGVWEKMVFLAENTSSSTDYLILVDVDYCKLGVFHGSKGNWEPLYYWDCSPGKSSTPTVRGHFKINSKGLYFYSGSAKCWYWSEFYNGEYAIHSVLYYPSGYVMDGRTGVHLSHGCVRVNYDNAYWVYETCPIGTTVYVY